jgi:hypothetical protein
LRTFRNAILSNHSDDGIGPSKGSATGYIGIERESGEPEV